MWSFTSKKVDSHFAGKTAWIAGASSGIGAALSRDLTSREPVPTENHPGSNRR